MPRDSFDSPCGPHFVDWLQSLLFAYTYLSTSLLLSQESLQDMHSSGIDLSLNNQRSWDKPALADIRLEKIAEPSG